MPENTISLHSRLLSKIAVQPNGCWWFTGYLNKAGYGVIGDGPKVKLAHRAMYECEIGTIPDGLSLDHTCHTRENCQGGPSCLHRRCINPSHMDPIPVVENAKRGHWATASIAALRAIHEKNRLATHCRRGHLMDDGNTRIRPDGARLCRACKRGGPLQDKAFCRNGHERTTENTYTWHGANYCRACSRAVEVKRKAKRAEARQARLAFQAQVIWGSTER